MTGTSLLIRKTIQAFIVGFIGALVTLLEGWSKAPSYHFDRSAIVAAIAGLVAAGARAAIALLPINLDPTDAQHTIKLGRVRGQSGQVNILLAIVILVIIIALFGGVLWSPWVFLLLLVVLLLLFR